MIIGLHHAQITVPDGAEEQARAFYCGVLGMREIHKPASLLGRGGLWVLAGRDQIHIGTEGGANRRASKAHLAYQVEDIQEWRERLAELAIEIDEGVQIPGFARFEFRDPFGNRVELIQSVTAD